jgi:TM2 domain-containing membrane protein YozV
MNNQVVQKGMKWLKRAVILKAGKMILKKPVSALGVGAVAAGVGIAAYSLIKKRKKNDLTHIDNIENNNPEVKGKKKIVV